MPDFLNEFLNWILFLPPQASTVARELDYLHYFVIITTMVASTAVGMTALFFFVRFRRRSEDQQTPNLQPSWAVEAGFVGVPLFFFLLWFGIGYAQFARLQAPPDDAMDVYVMGKQWMWKFTYPDGPNSISTLVVPADRPVRLLLTSRDVIHSFFVPEFRIKQDVLPGRYTQIWFEAVAPGTYQILCTEYCGLRHSEMRGTVTVLAPAEFDLWLERQKSGLVARQDVQPVAGIEGAGAPWVSGLGGDAGLETAAWAPQRTLATRGMDVAAQKGCLKCHTLDGEPHIGPTWLDLYLREVPLEEGGIAVADEAYLTESMMDPNVKIVEGYQPVMPTYQGRLSAPETAALVEFIKSLRAVNRRQEPTESIHEPLDPW